MTPVSPPLPITLTRRQREVLERFIEGKSVIAIATELHCAEPTVRHHLAVIAEQIPEKKHPPMRRLLVYGASLLAEGS